MARSLKKGPYVSGSLLKKAVMASQEGAANKVIKTWSRSTTIIPDFIGLTFAVHN